MNNNDDFWNYIWIDDQSSLFRSNIESTYLRKVSNGRLIMHLFAYKKDFTSSAIIFLSDSNSEQQNIIASRQNTGWQGIERDNLNKKQSIRKRQYEFKLGLCAGSESRLGHLGLSLCVMNFFDHFKEYGHTDLKVSIPV